MTTRLSAEIIHGLPGAETSDLFYVRSIARTKSLVHGTRGDAWAAYRDVPHKVGNEWLVKSDRLSDLPRHTIEEAVADMDAAVRRWLEPGMAHVNSRLVVDKFPVDDPLAVLGHTITTKMDKILGTTSAPTDAPFPTSKNRHRALSYAAGSLLASLDTVGSTSLVGDRLHGQDLAEMRAAFKQVAAELEQLAANEIA